MATRFGPGCSSSAPALAFFCARTGPWRTPVKNSALAQGPAPFQRRSIAALATRSCPRCVGPSMPVDTRRRGRPGGERQSANVNSVNLIAHCCQAALLEIVLHRVVAEPDAQQRLVERPRPAIGLPCATPSTNERACARRTARSRARCSCPSSTAPCRGSWRHRAASMLRLHARPTCAFGMLFAAHAIVDRLDESAPRRRRASSRGLTRFGPPLRRSASALVPVLQVKADDIHLEEEARCAGRRH